jgi:hypothetical protein
MRIARILSLAAVSLTLLAGSASAECAWVLWSETVTIGSLPQPPTEWVALKAEEAKAGCESGIPSHVAAAYNGYRERFGAAQRSDTSVATKTPWGVVSVYYRCLPDTIDPRAAAGRRSN